MFLSNYQVGYCFPKSIKEAYVLKAEYGNHSFYIAGGTDLLPRLEQDQIHPETLIDLTRIPALRKLKMQDNLAEIGTGITYSEILSNTGICNRVPILSKAIQQIGSKQIRNVATLVGNITSASPAGDALPPLYVLNAQVHISGLSGSRIIPIEKFVLGPHQTALEEGELVTKVSFELPQRNWLGIFEKVGLRHGMSIAVVSVAILLKVVAGRINGAHIALGAVAPTVIRVYEAEAWLDGKRLEEEIVEKTIDIIVNATKPISDIRASSNYRKLATAGIMRRILRNLEHNT